MTGRVLIVAGSDSGGGAGIQADIKTVTALGGYAACAITALTAQNTLDVYGIHEVPADFVAEQMVVVLDDIGADALKTGMLHRRDVIEAVARVIAERASDVPLVVDPVMVAKSGTRLITEDAQGALADRLLPLARLVTPNLPEAARLAGMDIEAEADMAEAARRILALGPKAVLVKGGHLEGETLVDLLVDGEGARRFTGPRIASRNTHGTGCTLASGIATGLAQGMALADAVARARAYVAAAIRTAPGLGAGHGPLDHAHPLAGCTGARKGDAA
ncbi:MAG TPA: bifunctional hydroxymethylpyrimidine kinase/phosphomethylpyrimidine kinase [Alphaproteobacteria bacterium]